MRWLVLLSLAACSVDPAPAAEAEPSPPSVASGVAVTPTASSAASEVPVARASASSTSSASVVQRAPSGPCPPEMVRVASTCVDRWEAHLVALDGMGQLRPHPHYDRPPEKGYYEARSAPGVKPQAYISRVEAERACSRAGKRLCSWLEWRRACQGRGWRRYPYGHGRRSGVCNVEKKHLLHELHGDDRPWTYEHFNDPALAREPGFLAATGEHQACVSPDGLYDMHGNLHEWVSTPVTEDFVERMEDEPGIERIDQPWVEGNGMFLGGFFSTGDQHGPGCHYTTVAHEPSYHDYSTGFRCCKDAVIPR